MSQQLIIIRGLPGSGKSTLADKLISLMRMGLEPALHFEADQYFIRDGRYKFNPAFLRNAHEWCQASVDLALKEGDSVIVSNTATQYWELKEYLNMAKRHNVPVRIIKCIGEFENVHGVPKPAIERMMQRWQDVEGEEIYNPLTDEVTL